MTGLSALLFSMPFILASIFIVLAVAWTSAPVTNWRSRRAALRSEFTCNQPEIEP